MATREYSELERQLNIIARAARDYDLKVNVDDLYQKACDLIDENGIDYYVTDKDFDFDWHHLSWNDGKGYWRECDGNYSEMAGTYMRAVNNGTMYVRIKEYEAVVGQDYYLVDDDIDSEGRHVGFLVLIKD